MQRVHDRILVELVLYVQGDLLPRRLLAHKVLQDRDRRDVVRVEDDFSLPAFAKSKKIVSFRQNAWW